jgi:hypothetical protein
VKGTITKESDGFWRTSEGFLAVVPKSKSGFNEEKCWFDFKPTHRSPTMRIEWPAEIDLALVPNDIGAVLMRRGWARTAREADAENWNAFVEAVSGSELSEDDIVDGKIHIDGPAPATLTEINKSETEGSEQPEKQTEAPKTDEAPKPDEADKGKVTEASDESEPAADAAADSKTEPEAAEGSVKKTEEAAQPSWKGKGK